MFQPSLHDVHQDHQTIASEGARVQAHDDPRVEIPWNNFDFSYQAYIALERKVEEVGRAREVRVTAAPAVRERRDCERRADARHQREPRDARCFRCTASSPKRCRRRGSSYAAGSAGCRQRIEHRVERVDDKLPMTTMSVIRTTIASMLGRTMNGSPPQLRDRVRCRAADAERGFDVDANADRGADLHPDHRQHPQASVGRRAGRRTESATRPSRVRCGRNPRHRLCNADADHAHVKCEEQQREREPWQSRWVTTASGRHCRVEAGGVESRLVPGRADACRTCSSDRRQAVDPPAAFRRIRASMIGWKQRGRARRTRSPGRPTIRLDCPRSRRAAARGDHEHRSADEDRQRRAQLQIRRLDDGCRRRARRSGSSTCARSRREQCRRYWK